MNLLPPENQPALPGFQVPAYRLCSHCGETKPLSVGWNWRQCPDCVSVYNAGYYALRSEHLKARVLERQHGMGDLFRDKQNARHRERILSDPDYVLRRLAQGRNRRARKANAVCEHGAGCFARAAELMPQFCAFCGSTENIHADHIVPLARGGSDCYLNIQPLCRNCNLRKGAK